MRAVHGVPHGAAAVALGHPSVASCRCPRGRAITLREASGPWPAPARLRVPRAGSPALRHCPRRGAAGSHPLGPHVPLLGAVTSRHGMGPPPGSSSCARRKRRLGANAPVPMERCSPRCWHGDGAGGRCCVAMPWCRCSDTPVPRCGAPLVPTGDAPVLACNTGAGVQCSGPARDAWCHRAVLGAGVQCFMPGRDAPCRRVVLGASVQSSVPVCDARCWHSDAPAVGAPSGPGPCRPPRRATAKLRHLKQRAGCPRGGAGAGGTAGAPWGGLRERLCGRLHSRPPFLHRFLIKKTKNKKRKPKKQQASHPSKPVPGASVSSSSSLFSSSSFFVIFSFFFFVFFLSFSFFFFFKIPS